MATSEVAHRQMDMVVDLEKVTEDVKSAPADAQLPAMAAAGGEKELLIPDLRHPPPEKHMPDLEKGIDQEGMDTPARQVSAVAEGEEQEHLILQDMRHPQEEQVGELAGKMNPGQKKWLAYWLLVSAASVIILNNHTKDQLLFLPPEVAMFIVVLCAIFLMLRAMKQMM